MNTATISTRRRLIEDARPATALRLALEERFRSRPAPPGEESHAVGEPPGVELIAAQRRLLGMGWIPSMAGPGQHPLVNDGPAWPTLPAIDLGGISGVTLDPSALTTVVNTVGAMPDHGYSHGYSGAFNGLARATIALDTSALTTVIQLFEGAGDESAFVILDGNHRVQAYQRAWYRDWSMFALPAALLGLDRDGFVELLRAERSRQRLARVPRLRPRRVVRSLHEQLERLANFISPHAPPALPLISGVAGVGVS